MNRASTRSALAILLCAGLGACRPGGPSATPELDGIPVEAVRLDHETRWAIRERESNEWAIRLTLPQGHVVLAFGWKGGEGRDDSTPIAVAASFLSGTEEIWSMVEDELPGNPTGELQEGWAEWRVRVPDPLAGREGTLRLRAGPRAGRFARRPREDRTREIYVALPTLVPARDPGKRPNVILISLDTLRSDRLGCYGHDRPTSPAMDGMASEGVLFRNALAQSSWTLPSTYTIMTSLHPSAHGVNPDRRSWAGYTHPSEAVEARGSGREKMLAERLRELGYMTAAVTENGWVYPRFGFDQGFVSYVADTHGSLAATSERVLEWIRAHGEMPFFLFLHTYQPHQPFDAPPPYEAMFVDPLHVGYVLPGVELSMSILNMLKDPAFPVMPSDVEALRALYDGDVRYTDTLVADLWKLLKEGMLGRDTVVVVTSDHGEELFEHGGFDHGDTLYDEVMRVPLIFWGPGRIVAGREIADPVALLDILPTVVELAGGTVEPPVQGRSLAGLLAGGGESLPSREIFAEVLAKGSGPLYGLWSGRYKYIRSGEGPIRETLYDLDLDPGETTSLVGERPDLAERYSERVDHLIRENSRIQENIGRARESLDPEVRERLRSLGYLD